MRFDDYLSRRLDEKVSKKEIEEALRNPRIFIGAEFEFICDNLVGYKTAGGSEYQDDYDYAYKMYKKFVKDWKSYERERDDLYSDMGKSEERRDELENEVADKDSEVDDAKEEIEGKDQLIKEMQKRIDKSSDEDEIRELRDEQKSFAEDLVELKSDLRKLEKELSKLKREFDVESSNYDQAESDYENLEYPYPGNDYRKYMEMMENDYGVGGGFNEYYYEDGDINEPPDPSDIGLSNDIGDEGTWQNAVNELEDDIFGDFPLNAKIEIVGYHGKTQKMGDTYWKAEYDASIADEGGIELISPPMKLSEFVDVCPKIFKWIEKHGGTNSSTGFHVHMSIEGVSDLKAVLDPIKLILFTDEGYIWNFFEGREFNHYTTSTKKTLSGRGVTRDDIQRLVNHTKLERVISGGHYESINFENWEKGHIEFRQMGGADYSRKWDKVKSVVAQHAHNLSIACDDTWKQQEYTTRLARVANKMDNMKYNRLSTWIYEFIFAIEDIKKDKSIELTPDEVKELDFVRVYIGAQANKIMKMMSQGGGLVDDTSSKILKSNPVFVKNTETFAKDKLTELIKNTKLSQMPRLVDMLGAYINKI